MRKILLGVIGVVAIAAIVGVVYFKSGRFHALPSGGQQSSWVAVSSPPGDRPKPEISLIREFGAWHLSCVNRLGQPAPKIGFVQNLGIVPQQQMGGPTPCHVFIMMRDTAARGQTMLMSFRYRTGFTMPEVAVIYTIAGNTHVIYQKTGEVVDLSKQKMSLRGGFYRDQQRNRPSHSQPIPVIGVQLGRANLTIQTANCVKGHCFGHASLPVTGGATGIPSVVVRLPGSPHGQPRIVNVPADRLEQALAELKRMNAS